MIQLIVATITLFAAVAVQLINGQDLTHYEPIASMRCIGGDRISVPGDTAEMCASLCIDTPNCIGFNFVKAATLCVARSFGCELTEDPNCVFYKKKIRHPKSMNQDSTEEDGPQEDTGAGDSPGPLSVSATTLSQQSDTYVPSTVAENQQTPMTEPVPTPEPAQPSPDTQPTPTEIAYSLESAPTPESAPSPIPTNPPQHDAEVHPTVTVGVDWSIGFLRDEGKRCVGGGRIGEQSEGPEKCAAICSQSPECAGFNYNEANNLCVARSSDCSEVEEAHSVFFRKKGVSLNPLHNQPPEQQIMTYPNSVPMSPPKVGSESVGNADVASSGVDGFERLEGKRCAGTRLGEPAQSLEKCATICQQIVECFGFNFVKNTGICVARGADCTLVEDEGATFFKRQGKVPQPIQPAQPPPPSMPSSQQERPEKPEITQVQPVKGPTTPANPPSADGSMPNYEIFTGKRCTGGYKIGEPSNLVERCATICSYSSECAGFNFIETNCSCVAVTLSCTQTDDSGGIFYKKKGTGDAVGKAHPFPPTGQKLIPGHFSGGAARPDVYSTGKGGVSGFTIKDKTRCAAGSSKSVGVTTGLNQCTDLCRNTPDCYGFNFSNSSGTCVLRSIGCELQDAGEDISFYRKIAS